MITILPIIFNFSISEISTIVLLIGYCITLFNTIMCFKLPKMFPEQWAKSNFHMGKVPFTLLLLLSICVTLVQFYAKLRTTTWMILGLNLVTIVGAFLYATYRQKSGTAKPTLSYELET